MPRGQHVQKNQRHQRKTRLQYKATHKRPEHYFHEREKPTITLTKSHNDYFPNTELTTGQKLFCIFVVVNLFTSMIPRVKAEQMQIKHNNKANTTPMNDAGKVSSYSVFNKTGSLDEKPLDHLANNDVYFRPTESPPAGSLIACDQTDAYCVAMSTINIPVDDDNCTHSLPGGCDKLNAYVSKDGQNSWEKTVDNLSIHRELHDLHSIKCAPDMQHCVVTGDTHDGHSRLDWLTLLLSTQDGGYHWQTGPISSCSCCSPFWASQFLDADSDPLGQKWVVVGACRPEYNPDQPFRSTKAQSFVSDDGGVNWRRSHKEPYVDSTDYYVDKVVCNKETNQCITYGKANGVPITFFSNDYGDHWQEVTESNNNAKLVR